MSAELLRRIYAFLLRVWRRGESCGGASYVFSHSGEGVPKRGEQVYLIHGWSEEGPLLVSRGAEFLT